MASSKTKYKVNFDEKKVKSKFIFGLAEKPTAANRIAKILDPNYKVLTFKVTRKQGTTKTILPEIKGYSINFQSEQVVILSALGHLFTLVQDGFGWQYPVYDFKWVPISEVQRQETKFTQRIEATIESIRTIALMADHHVIMTDYDEEGEVIGGLTLAQLLGNNAVSRAKRMRFSSFASDEIKKAFIKSIAEKSAIHKGMYNRGLMRHYLDWLWGINLSRALMLSLKNTTGKYHTLSTGRVQGPTLSFVAQREFERRTFVPVPIFKLSLAILKGVEKIDLIHSSGSISTQADALALRKQIQGHLAKVESIKKRKVQTKPPVPYNLSSLQKDAYKFFKLSPSRLLRIAEKLYLAASISYPRTSSESYPQDMVHEKVIKKLSRQKIHAKSCKIVLENGKFTPIEGKKKDPAHPCIYPTGTAPKVSNETEKKVYSLIVHRYLAGFGENAVSESNRVNFTINVEKFHVTGSRIVYSGWRSFADILGKTTETQLPEFKKGEELDVALLEVDTSYSRSLPAFNQASLLRMMETFEIGTKATRSEIINSIFNRKYLTGESIRLTPVGEIVNEVLQTYSPQVVSVDLSRNLEKMGDLLEQSYNESNDLFNLQDAITQGILHLHEMLNDLRNKEQEIGFLIDLNLSHHRKEEIRVGMCRVCKRGTLKILRSTRTGKRFIGCSEFFRDKSCRTTYPLPQKGRIESLKADCKSDGFPQLKVSGGKRPWILCLNPECELRKDYIKKEVKK